ncbi:MAG: NUDIX hydrolase [Bacillota bacterium]|jgi:ADP-ribose pyrophosphatase|nr:NUDIX hydrolase [Bacillota bacterium]
MSEPGRKHEVSAGVVVFRGDQVLIIKNRFGEWVLPKGKVEAGETPEAAALREVEEETGVRAEILRPAGTSEYTYLSEHTGEPVDKVVYWFLGRDAGATVGDGPGEGAGPTPQREEGISAACFVPWQEAVALLKYDGALVRSAAAEALRDA